LSSLPKHETDSVIDLLATWEATAIPGVGELLELVEELSGHEPLALLEQLLADSPPLSEKSRGELESLVASAAPFEGELLARTESEVRAGLASARDRLAERLTAWSPLLAADRLPTLVRQFARLTGEGNGIADDLTSWAALKRCRSAFLQARDEATSRVRVHVAGMNDEAARERVLAALESDEGSALLAAAQALRVKAEEPPVEEAPAEPPQRLLDLCRRARQAADDPGVELEPAGAVLLRHAAEQAERDATIAGGEAAKHWTRTLQQLIEAPARPAGPSTQERQSLTTALAERADSLIASGVLDAATRTDVRRAADAVRDAAAKGGGSFVKAMSAAEERLTPTTPDNRGGLGELNAAVAELRQLLDRSAADLPTARVFELRQLLDRADACADSSEGEPVATVQKEIRKAAERGSELARQVGVAEKKRERSATRQRIISAGLLLDVVGGRDARDLTKAIDAAKTANEDRVEEALERLGRLQFDIEHSIRLDACEVLIRAERALQKSGEDDESDELSEPAHALREALADGETLAIAGLADEVADQVGRPPLWTGTLGRAGLAIAVVVVLATTGWLARGWLGQESYTYRVTREMAPLANNSSTLKLIRDGAIWDAKPFSPEGTDFPLPPGRYELYVDDSYTGHTFVISAQAAESDNGD